jgi:pimeloyl-ACP methyl ester carboxylesterase
MKIKSRNLKLLGLLFLSLTILVYIISSLFSGFASAQNNTLMQPEGEQGKSPNATNIVLVHGSWSDGSVWNKVIPILKNAGHTVIAAQLPLYSLTDDIAAVDRVVERIGGPTVLVGHSYGGEVITNAGHNNPNVTGLVYIAAIAPDEGETGNDFFEQIPEEFSRRFNESIAVDSGGFLYFIPEKVHESFAQDVDPVETDILAVVQKPFNQSIIAEKSGPPAWKQVPTWYQISENDRLLPPEIQRFYSERMNATTVSLNASHFSQISLPDEVAQLIINATIGSGK